MNLLRRLRSLRVLLRKRFSYSPKSLNEIAAVVTILKNSSSRGERGCFTTMRIEDLNEEIRKCSKCRLSETRINALCGEGNLNAKLMLIAQAPGENEDRKGKMFIGPSGKVLDELLRMANIDRRAIYMTNLVKCMLPKYRKPKWDEIQTCSKYLDKEIESIDPKVLVPLGYYATKYIFEKYVIPLPSKPGFQKIYGKVFFCWMIEKRSRCSILPLLFITIPIKEK